MEPNHDATGLLDQALDAASEKRGATREEGWAKFNHNMALNYSYDWVDKRRESILEVLLPSLKKGSEKEVSLALRALALVTVTLGADSEELWLKTADLLQVIAKDDTKPGPLRSEALDALTMLAFATNSNVEKMMEFFRTFKRSSIADSAFRNWGVLATLRDQEEHEKIFSGIIEDLVAALESSNLEVRLAAGENIAYLVEVERDIAAEDDAPFSLDDLCPDVVTMSEVLETLQDLSAERNRHQAKDKVLKQRSGFREIVRTVEEGDFEPVVMEVNRTAVHFDNWAQLKRINFFRQVIGEGLQEHFVSNELLHEVFEANIPLEAGKNPFSGVGKRMFMSPNSATAKERTRQLAKNRALAHSTDDA